MADAYDVMSMAKRSGARAQQIEDWEKYQDELAAFKKKQGKGKFWGGLGTIAAGILMPALMPALASGGLGSMLMMGAARGGLGHGISEMARNIAMGGKSGQPTYKGTSTGPYGRAGAKTQQRKADIIQRSIKDELQAGERNRLFTSMMSGFAHEFKKGGAGRKSFKDLFKGKKGAESAIGVKMPLHGKTPLDAPIGVQMPSGDATIADSIGVQMPSMGSEQLPKLLDEKSLLALANQPLLEASHPDPILPSKGDGFSAEPTGTGWEEGDPGGLIPKKPFAQSGLQFFNYPNPLGQDKFPDLPSTPVTTSTPIRKTEDESEKTEDPFSFFNPNP